MATVREAFAKWGKEKMDKLANNFECISVSDDGHEPPIIIRGVDINGHDYPVLFSFQAAEGVAYYLNKGKACGRENWTAHEVQTDA